MPAAEAVLRLDRRIAFLRQRHPELEPAIRLHETAIRATLDSPRPPAAAAFLLPAERLAEKLRGGIPALHAEPATVDVHFAADLFGRMLDALVRHDHDLEPVVAAATSGALDPESLFAEAFVQHPDHLSDIARRAGLELEALGPLATLSVAPLLRAYADRLLPLMERLRQRADSPATWERGYCPVCGAWPALAELGALDHLQVLRCGACAAAWSWPPARCPFCETDALTPLATPDAEPEPRYRLLACARCRGYLKLAHTVEPTPPALLPLEDLASSHLDTRARDLHYHRPPASGFRIELSLVESEWAEDLASMDID